MSIKVRFYKISDENNKIQKTLGTMVAEKECDVYELSSIISPQFTVNYQANLLTCNYIYVPEYHRYYYITNIASTSAKRMLISCQEDVLMTYKDQILATEILLDRTGTTEYRDAYIPDANEQIKQYTETFILNFQYRFSDNGGSGVYVLSK